MDPDYDIFDAKFNERQPRSFVVYFDKEVFTHCSNSSDARRIANEEAKCHPGKRVFVAVLDSSFCYQDRSAICYN